MRTSTNSIRKLVCFVIAFVISIFPVPLTSLALEEDVSYYSVQDNLSYEVVTRITSSWDKHQNIEMTFVNTGYEVIHNWYFLYNSPYEIINIWNSEIVESDSNLTYIISNCSYNQDIPVGGSVTIGMTLESEDSSDMNKVPSWYLLNTDRSYVEDNCYEVIYQENSSWEDNFYGALIVSSNITMNYLL